MSLLRALLGFVLLFAAACDSCKSAPEAFRLDEHRYLGAPVTVANLTVWPVHTDAAADVGPFLTLAEAQAQGKAAVREVSGGGEVGKLFVRNGAECPILVCAGTVVRGGKQDRQIAQDFVIQAGKEVAVDAFCVEPGRWDGEVDFEAADFIALKDVRAKGQYERDQSEVWGEVARARSSAVVRLSEPVLLEEPTRDLGAYPEHQAPFSLVGVAINQEDILVLSETSRGEAQVDLEDSAGFNALDDPALSNPGAVTLGTSSSLCDVFEVSTDRQEEMAAAVRKHFAELGEKPVGFAYAINGVPVTVRTFANHRLLDSVLESFVATMCLEACLAPGEGEARAEDVLALVRAIDGAEAERQETEAANTNLYRRAEAGFHASCLLGPIALTQDWTKR